MDQMKECCMDSEELQTLIQACGVDGKNENEVCLAAGLKCAGFSEEEIREYLKAEDRAQRIYLLSQKREEIVKEIHYANECLAKVDYLLWMERSQEK